MFCLLSGNFENPGEFCKITSSNNSSEKFDDSNRDRLLSPNEPDRCFSVFNLRSEIPSQVKSDSEGDDGELKPIVINKTSEKETSKNRK